MHSHILHHNSIIQLPSQVGNNFFQRKDHCFFSAIVALDCDIAAVPLFIKNVSAFFPFLSDIFIDNVMTSLAARAIDIVDVLHPPNPTIILAEKCISALFAMQNFRCHCFLCWKTNASDVVGC